MYIYVLITRTPTVVGKVIRRVLDNKYNHMSVCTEKDLSEIYSFGRISVKNFIVGGPLKESYYTLSLGSNENVELCVFRIPVTKHQYEKIQYFIHSVFYDEEGYIYNLPDAIGKVFKRKIKVNKCYTCIEFTKEALAFAGVRAASLLEHAESLDSARQKLKRYTVYEGKYRAYPDVYLKMTDTDKQFMERRGFYKEFRSTTKTLKKIIGRMYRTKFSR
ncbi:MAG: hypothetical protein IJN39_06785 [Clostridia bacterium]|nr:hypothetical protein [Clostridia bacterium]